MQIISKEYKLSDFIKIPLSVSPVWASLLVFNKIIRALVPSFKVLATAAFIDTSINIFNGLADRNQIILPLLYLFLLIIYGHFSYALFDLAGEKFKIKLTETYRTAVMEKRAALEYRHIENNDTMELINRIGGDPAGWISDGFDSLLYMAELIIRVCSILFVLAAQVWWAAVIILIFSVPLFKIAIKSGKVTYEASKEAAAHTRRADYLKDVLTGRENAEERALFGYSDALNLKWHEKFMTAYKITFKAERRKLLKKKSAGIITLAISFLVVGVLIVPLSSGGISIGMFMGLVSAAFSLVQTISWSLSYAIEEIIKHREFIRDFSNFARLSEKQGKTDLPAESIAQPECIEFQDVSFAYPETETMILKNFNLKLYAHKHYAFVGMNGAGKTTVTKLLTGLYDNYIGDILIDGKNLRDFTQAELKALFSVVYQDFAKYQIPMVDSIGIGNVREMGADIENIENAVQLLELNEAVKKLPDGLNTPLGKISESGVDISGGEWQRVAIARAIVNPAPIHILDEPTAALDPAAESAVYEMFGKISKGKSTIFITHRLGAARLADIICVIADGHVAEQGSHDTLIKKGGIYAGLFESQRGWYI
ncbi:MAG: ABC transporter ATP-binding protein/permease [Eubacterium sp.]|nr:ABC transporter ATP-binding protein/permease [Eubacterium sp.]